MADLTEIQSSGSTKIAGADPATGIESFFVNADSNGNILSNVTQQVTMSDRVGSGTVTALAGTVAAITNGCSTVNFLLSGTWTALLLIEGTVDNGVTWTFLNGDADATDTITTSVSTNTRLTVPCGGLQQVRLRAISYTSGTVAIAWNAGAGLALIETFSSDRNGTGTITALNGTAVGNTQAASTVQFNITGTWVATLIIEGFLGNNWIAISGDIDSTDTVSTTFTSNGLVTVNCGGFSQVRLRASLFTSGTVTVDWNSGAGVALVEVFNGNGNQLKVKDIIDISGQNRAQSITTTAAEALGAATILLNRKIINILPTNGTVYWGYTTGVTTTTGTPIFKNQNYTISVSDNVHIYLIAASTIDCRISEGS